MKGTVYYLNFPISAAEKPVINSMISKYNVGFNILKASISAENGGELYLELTGSEDQIVGSVSFLKEQNVQVVPLERTIIFKREDCIDCGTCTAVCLTGALEIKSPEFRLKFDEGKCVVCGACVKACPLRLFTLEAGSKNV